jgi:DNA-binding NtrC family response regulator
MHRRTIFFISDDHTETGALFQALRDAGYEVATTSSRLQAIALLFVMHSVAAVLVDQRSEEHASFDLPRKLRAVRHDVPLIVLCREQVSRPPDYVDACVCSEEPLDRLLYALEAILDRPKVAA